MPFIALVIYGVLSACFALLIELILLTLAHFSTYTAVSVFPFEWSDSFSLALVGVLIIVALVEESSKYLFLRQYGNRFFRDALSEPQGALFLGALFGLAFSALEVFLILRSAASLPLLPIVGLIAIHMVTSIIFTRYLFTKTLERPYVALGPLFSAVLLHTLYNLGAFFLG